MEAILSTNEINNFSVSELNYIRESIENMNKFNQIEVLRILNKHNDITINENKYGIHINISELKKEILDELIVYINYVKTQEMTLNTIEQKKEDYKNTYFSKDIKDNNKIFNK
jgi:NTP pyrophosphatase (non-canonical NTP hydrolase)